MPYIAAFDFEYPHWDEAQQAEIQQKGRLENPYNNYLHLLQHLKTLATDAPLSELRRFADCGDLSLRKPGSPWSRYSLLLFQWTEGPPKKGWYDFDENEYTQLLTEDNLLQGCFDGNSYQDLDYYLVGLAEKRALCELPEGPEFLQALWLHENLANFYWQTYPLRPLLAALCQSLGWPWFCGYQQQTKGLKLKTKLAEISALKRFRSGLLALLAAQQWGDQESQHDQLVALHDTLVLDPHVDLTQAAFKDLRRTIQEAIEESPELGI